MLIPVEADVPFDKRPFTNWLIIAVNIIVFGITTAMIIEAENPEVIDPYLLKGWNWPGIVTHMWLHGDFFHILGNMIFLWVFGNAVCYKLGNLLYFPVYLFLGACSTVAYILFTGDHPALGASGAINGIVGMYLILFPTNNITMMYWFALFIRGTFEITGYWMILFWFAFDILGLVMGGGGVAYMAHIGGFVGGVVLAYVLLHFDIIRMEPRFELSLVDILRGKHIEEAREFEQMYNRSSMDFLNEQYDPDQPLNDPIEISSQAPAVRRPVEDILSDEDFLGPNRALSDPVARPPAMIGQDDIIEDVVPPVYSPASQVQPDRLQKPQFVRFFCECGQKVKIPAKYAGKTGKCPKCRKRLKIPELS